MSEPGDANRLLSLDDLLEHQHARLADVRDRIEHVAMQQAEMQYQLMWLDKQLAQFQRILTRGTGRP
jgi:hypothetical protein